MKNHDYVYLYRSVSPVAMKNHDYIYIAVSLIAKRPEVT